MVSMRTDRSGGPVTGAPTATKIRTRRILPIHDAKPRLTHKFFSNVG